MNNLTLKPHILNLIEKRIKGFLDGYRQNIAVLGYDRNELFSVLEKCRDTAKSPGTVFLALDPSYLGAKDMFKAAAHSLLIQHSGQNESLDHLLHNASSLLPKTTEHIKNVLAQRKVSCMELLEMINTYINETSCKCIFVLNDFTSLSDVFRDSLQPFTQFIILQQKCMTILSSSCVTRAKKILGSEFNLLFGNFEIISLDDHSLPAGYLYFRDLLRPLTPPADFTAFFINMIHSNASHYELIAPEIKYEFSDNWDETAVNVLQRTLYGRNSTLFRTFTERMEKLKSSSKDHRLLIKILTLISAGYTRRGDLKFFTGLDSRKLSLKIQSLLETEYIRQMGSIYLITDQLFAFWIDTVFRLYLSPHIFDSDMRCMLFRQTIKEKLSLFRDEFSKEKTQRISDLFSSFKDDTVVIEKQKLKFPALNKIKVISYPEKGMDLLVGEGDDIVFAGIKQDDTTETDMIDFIRTTDSIKIKNIRKIFISLGEPNPSARFIAKERKVSLWDMNELNNIMRIYCKPILL